MSQITLKLQYVLGDGAFGTVYSAIAQRGSTSISDPVTLSTDTTYAVKVLKSFGSSQPNLFLRNAIRELCAFPDAHDDIEAFNAKFPHVADVWFVHPQEGKLGVSPLGTVSPHGSDGSHASVVVVLKKYTIDCAILFGTKLSSSNITHVVMQLLQSVHSLHARGIAHRDIKPGNMLIDLSTGDVVLSDFGFVSLLEGKMCRKSSMDLCTIDTRAPELCLDADDDGVLPVSVTMKADMWSVGIVLLSALLGVGSQPLGKVAHLETDKEKLREFLRKRFAGDFKPLGPDPGPHPKTFRQWLARVLGAESNLEEAAKSVPLMTLGQMWILTECLRLNPAERPTAKELLTGLASNFNRGHDPSEFLRLMHPFAIHMEKTRKKAQEMQEEGTMLSHLSFGPQTLLNGKIYPVGHDIPVYKTEPFLGTTDEGRKERIRTLQIFTVMLRCYAESFSKSSDPNARYLRLTDSLLASVDFFDRLVSSDVMKRTVAMTRTAASTVSIPSLPTGSTLESALTFDPRYDRRDLQIVCVYLADLALRFDGQCLRRLIRTAYPSNCNMFKIKSKKPQEPDPFCIYDESAAVRVYDSFVSLKVVLLSQWTLEAVRSLGFDLVTSSLLFKLQRKLLHRNREFVLGVLKTLETVPSTLVDLATIKPHAEPLDWNFSKTDDTRQPFDVDF